MVNVPKEIEKLYKTGSVKKRYVFSFPNGERDDITNENLISESVSFTESICSQDRLKFGLCEAPVLEFETAGVENIKGMEIEASIEIDTSTMEKAEITLPLIEQRTKFEIVIMGNVDIYGYRASDLNISIDAPDYEGFIIFGVVEDFVVGGDGLNIPVVSILLSEYIGVRATISVKVNDLATELFVKYKLGFLRDDSPYPYYPIPIGRFIVQECPRKADLFERRQVTAYGISFDSLSNLNSIEKAKRNVKCTRKTPYRIDAEKYVYSSLLGDFEIPGATYNTFYNSSGSNSSIHQWGDDTYFKYSYNWYVFDNESDEQELYRVKYNSEYTFETLNNAIAEYFEENYPSLKDNIISKFNLYGTGEKLFYPEMIYFTPYGLSTGLMKGQGYLYPYSSSGLSYDDYTRQLQITKTITIGNEELGDIVTFTLRENADISVEYVILENHTPIWLEIPRKKDGSYYKVAEQLHYPLEVIEGLLELKGKFGRYGRDGKFEEVSLKDKFGFYPSETLYPYGTLFPSEANGGYITKANYMSLWFDDEITKPIGKITAPFLNLNGEESVAEYEIPESITPNNEQLMEEVSVASNVVEFQWVSITENQEIRIECPYPIKEASVSFVVGGAISLPISVERNAFSFVLNRKDVGEDYADQEGEISIIFETQYSYKGSAYLYKYDKEINYYADGESRTYSLENNYILQNTQIEESVLAKLLEEMASNIKDVFYLPCEIELQGLPYLESGDAIQIDSEIGFQTIVMRRTMNGIQSLVDEIESKG